LISIHTTLKVNILKKLLQTEQKSRSIITILYIIYHFILLWILSLSTKEHSIIPNNLKLKNTKIVQKKRKFTKKKEKDLVQLKNISK